MHDANDLQVELQPLLQVLEGGRNVRLVARAGAIAVDRPEGATAVATAWDGARHRAALERLGGEVCRLASGITVSRVGDALVLRAPANPQRRIADLVRDGWLSNLSARTLTAAVALGRNLLVAGPWCAAADFIGALLADGERPCVVGRPEDAVPAAWPLFAESRQALLYGADRIGSWSLPTSALPELLGSRNAVIAWVDARRLDRALIRYEAAAAPAGSSPAPIHVLAAIDLVVVLEDFGGPRVAEIAEIALVEDGYRPRLLFASGRPPVTSALIPLAAPSFINDLERSGQTVLADELRHADASRAAAPSSPVNAVAAAPRHPARGERLVVPARPDVAAAEPPPSVVSPPRASELVDAAVPGWELDQAGDDATTNEVGAVSADDAALAATYGLGPPPRPASLRSAADTRGFEEALKRARERNDDEDPTRKPSAG
jgi:hypothetical protein